MRCSISRTIGSPSSAWPTIISRSRRRSSARDCRPRSRSGCAVASEVLTAGVRGLQGTVIDGFTLGERLNAGGAGYVFRATPPPWQDPGFPIVMKVPAVGPGEPSVGILGFEMELMIHPALEGPHVPRFVAAGDLRAVPYLVMEYVEGESLVAAIERTPLAFEEVARLGAAVADALHDLHAQHAVHHDLKPENVI